MSILTTESAMVWTYEDGSAVDHAITPAMPAAGIKNARVSIEAKGLVGDITLNAFYQYSWDGFFWDTAGLIGPMVDSSTIGVDTSFADITSGQAPFIRFGVRAENDSSGDLNTTYVVLRIETRSS